MSKQDPGHRDESVQDHEGRGRRRWQLLIFLVALAVYAGTIGHGFVFDDDIAVVRNSHIRSLSSVPEIFASTEWAGGGLQNRLYRPLTVTTYALNYRLSGLSPWSYHLVNVVLHGMVSVLVFGLALRWRLSTITAALAALIFAVHPIHTEAVASIVGRRDLLAALFMLTMILAHSRASRRGGFELLVPILAYVCAMLSKEVGAVGIGLVLLHDYLLVQRQPTGRRVDRRTLILYGSYAVLLLAFLAVRYVVVGGVGVGAVSPFDNPAAQTSTGMRWLTAFAVIGKGVTLQVAPFRLSPDYSYDAIPLVEGFADLRFIASLIALAATSAFAVQKRRSRPLYLLALGWYGLCLLPASNILFPVGTIFGERLLYIPSVAVCVVAAVAVGAVSRRGPAWTLPALAAVVLVSLAARSIRYASVWSDDLSLFSEAARTAPRSTKVQLNLGAALLRDGRVEAALSAAQRAVTIAPDNYKALVLVGESNRELGRRVESERALRQALSIKPEYADALYGLGKLQRDQSRLDEAGELWRRVLELDPGHAGALSDLGTLHFVRRDLRRAREYSERAVEANPSQANAWYNLGLLYELQGDAERARRAFEEFVRVAGPPYEAQVEEIRRRLE
jgi:tetratricopeptide (TPR) repeat protein